MINVGIWPRFFSTGASSCSVAAASGCLFSGFSVTGTISSLPQAGHFRSFALNGGVARALQMLVGDVSIFVLDLVVPFRTHEDETIGAENRIAIVLVGFGVHPEDRAAVVELLDESLGFHVVAFEREAEAVVGGNGFVEKAVSDNGHVGVLGEDAAFVS